MKVLIAEDEPTSRWMLENTLVRWAYEVIPARDGEEALAALQEPDAPVIAILDWMMPGLDGIEVCRRVREQAREPYVYIILLTVRGDKAGPLEGMEAGADDFLGKPFDEEELRARLRAGERILDLHAEVAAAREALRIQANRDTLTGVLNRRTILEILTRELARSRREGSPLSVAIADLDRFKAVNDQHGHAGGDAVLRQAASRMAASLRPYDALGRWGGEEFLVVLPGCDARAAAVTAERLRARLGAEPIDAGGHAITVTCSLGVATLEPGGGEDERSLLSAADAALYRAKENGRDRVEVATSA